MQNILEIGSKLISGLKDRREWEDAEREEGKRKKQKMHIYPLNKPMKLATLFVKYYLV